MSIQVKYEDLGLAEYAETWQLQENYFNGYMQRKLESMKQTGSLPTNETYRFILCEHPPVYTLGKSGDEHNLLINSIQLQAKNATFHKTNRGGDITFHGPGQIVGYPILDLEAFGLGIKTYIEFIEEAIINTIADYGLQGHRLEGATGVWLDIDKPGKTRKICAIGVKASRHISMHGFAFNVNTDLQYFNYINPCGFTDKGVTSLQKELGREMDFEEVKQKVKGHFQQRFGWEWAE